MDVILGDITKLEVDAIVSAANGHVGVMGKGVALAIRSAGGIEIEQNARELCQKYKFNPGQTYYTKSGKLKCKYIIHAVTMKYPGQSCPPSTVEACLPAVVLRAKQLKCKKIAIPGLGTGIGRATLSKVAEIYERLLPELEKRHGVKIIICDINKGFIEKFGKTNLIRDEENSCFSCRWFSFLGCIHPEYFLDATLENNKKTCRNKEGYSVFPA